MRYVSLVLLFCVSVFAGCSNPISTLVSKPAPVGWMAQDSEFIVRTKPFWVCRSLGDDDNRFKLPLGEEFQVESCSLIGCSKIVVNTGEHKGKHGFIATDEWLKQEARK